MPALVPDKLWNEIEPLLPKHATSPKGGRPPVSDRACLAGIIFILKSGLPWNLLPPEMGCGSGVTCWRRLRDWTRQSVWPELHARLLRCLGRRGSLNLARAVIDSASMRAVFWGDHTGPNPTDRAKNGSKRHVITDARGVPLVVQTGPANQPDSHRALAMLDKIPAVAGRRGRPRRKPKAFQGDAAYGTAAIIQQVAARGIRPLLAPYGHTRRTHGSGLGKTRYVVERTLSWFGNFRRIKFCYERTAEHLQAFHELAASLICLNKLRPKRT